MNEEAARRSHWETVYGGRDERELSWYQTDPGMSFRLVSEQATLLPSGKASAVIDAGGGTSALADRLTGDGFTDVTVVDIALPALTAAASRSGESRVTRIPADLLTWKPEPRYQIWHDRAVFHFLAEPADRAAYFSTLRAAMPDGGAIIMATFAPDGPDRCSSLPVTRYDADSLAAELTAALGDAVSITGHHAEEHRTPWDAPQPFTWLTARLA